jgi:hypothetical protein
MQHVFKRKENGCSSFSYYASKMCYVTNYHIVWQINIGGTSHFTLLPICLFFRVAFFYGRRNKKTQYHKCGAPLQHEHIVFVGYKLTIMKMEHIIELCKRFVGLANKHDT